MVKAPRQARPAANGPDRTSYSALVFNTNIIAMSIDVDWSKLAGGEDRVRQFIHDKFQQVSSRCHSQRPAS